MTKALMKPKGRLLKHLIRDSYQELQMRYESHERDPEFIPSESIEIKVLVQYLWQYFCLSHSWLPPKATCKADNYLATDEDKLCVPTYISTLRW